MRLSRPVSLFVPATVLLLAACVPDPPNPLDWRISAETPNDYNHWCSTHEPRMSTAVHNDFSTAIQNLSATSRRFGQAFDMRETNNPLCIRVNGLTVREVIVDGLLIGRDEAAARLSLEQENQLRNVQQEPKAVGDPRRMAAFQRARTNSTRAVDALRAHIARIETRIHFYENGGDPDLLPPAAEKDDASAATD